jgi:transcriptional regulator with XRE-family HTH domain
MSTSTTRKRTDAGKALAQRLGHCIARHRKAHGLTQEELSERLSVDPKSMARIERGAVLPSLQRMFEISEALDVPVTQLLGEASSRDKDLVDWLSQRLQKLQDEDRLRILDLVERLSR